MKNNKPPTDKPANDDEKIKDINAKISEIWTKFLNLSAAEQRAVLSISRRAAEKMPNDETRQLCNEVLDTLETLADPNSDQQQHRRKNQ